MTWVPNEYDYILVLDAGPYLGTDFPPLTPPISTFPSDSNYYEIDWVVQGQTSITTNDPFYDGTPNAYGYTGRYNDPYEYYGNTGKYPSGAVLSDLINPHLYVVLYGGNTNRDGPSAWSFPTEPENSFWPSAYASGGTAGGGAEVPVIAADNTTISTARYIGQLFASTPRMLVEQDINLDTTGVTWWYFKTSPNMGLEASRASGGVTVTAPFGSIITVWSEYFKMNGFTQQILTDRLTLMSQSPGISGSGSISVPTLAGDEYHLVRVTGSGISSKGFKVLGPARLVGDHLAYAYSDWFAVPASRTGTEQYASLIPQYQDGYFIFYASYAKSGLNGSEVSRDFQTPNGFSPGQDTIQNPVYSPRQSILSQFIYQVGLFSDEIRSVKEIQGTVHYSASHQEQGFHITYDQHPELLHFDPSSQHFGLIDPGFEPVNPLYPKFDIEFYDPDIAMLPEVIVIVSTAMFSEHNDTDVHFFLGEGRYCSLTTNGYPTESSGISFDGQPDVHIYSPGPPNGPKITAKNIANTGISESTLSLRNRSNLDGTDWWVAPDKQANSQLPVPNTSDKVASWSAQLGVSVGLIVRVPRYRYKYTYVTGINVYPMRQRHRNDGLATDAREHKGFGSSQQISIRQGGRTYY